MQGKQLQKMVCRFGIYALSCYTGCWRCQERNCIVGDATGLSSKTAAQYEILSYGHDNLESAKEAFNNSV